MDEHDIWTIEQYGNGFYAEGVSTKIALPDYPDGYGWFCFEVGSHRELIAQLSELGFSPLEVGA